MFPTWWRHLMRNCAFLEGKGSELCLVDATGSKLKGVLQNEGLSLGLAGNHQYGNAALAVALCQSVTDAIKSNRNKRIEIDSPTTVGALASAKWPGRCQTLEWFCKDVAGYCTCGASVIALATTFALASPAAAVKATQSSRRLLATAF